MIQNFILHLCLFLSLDEFSVSQLSVPMKEKIKAIQSYINTNNVLHVSLPFGVYRFFSFLVKTSLQCFFQLIIFRWLRVYRSVWNGSSAWQPCGCLQDTAYPANCWKGLGTQWVRPPLCADEEAERGKVRELSQSLLLLTCSPGLV